MREILIPTPRKSTPLSSLSGVFDVPMVSTTSGRTAALAFSDSKLYAVTDQAGGRRVHGIESSDWRLLDGSPDWVESVRGGEKLVVTPEPAHSATSGLLRRSERRVVAGSTVVIATALSPVSTRVGVSSDSTQEAVTCDPHVIGGPVSDGRHAAWCVETWPSSYLCVVEAGEVDARRLALPPGLLSSLTCDGSRWAAVWESPVLAPCVLSAEDPFELVAAAWDASAVESATRVEYSTEGRIFARSSQPGANKGVVVILHGGPHACWLPSFSPLAAFLVELGWTVVHPNVVGSTLTTTFQSGLRFGVDDAVDLGSIISAVAKDGLPTVAIGWSYGAYLAARAAMDGAPVCGLVSLSGFFGPDDLAESSDPGVRRFIERANLPSVAWSTSSPVPRLIIHGALDERVPPAAMRRYSSDTLTTYVEVDREGHGIATDMGAAIAYAALRDWLEHTTFGA